MLPRIATPRISAVRLISRSPSGSARSGSSSSSCLDAVPIRSARSASACAGGRARPGSVVTIQDPTFRTPARGVLRRAGLGCSGADLLDHRGGEVLAGDRGDFVPDRLRSVLECLDVDLVDLHVLAQLVEQGGIGVGAVLAALLNRLGRGALDGGLLLVAQAVPAV